MFLTLNFTIVPVLCRLYWYSIFIWLEGTGQETCMYCIVWCCLSSLYCMFVMMYFAKEWGMLRVVAEQFASKNE